MAGTTGFEGLAQVPSSTSGSQLAPSAAKPREAVVSTMMPCFAGCAVAGALPAEARVRGASAPPRPLHGLPGIHTADVSFNAPAVAVTTGEGLSAATGPEHSFGEAAREESLLLSTGTRPMPWTGTHMRRCLGEAALTPEAPLWKLKLRGPRAARPGSAGAWASDAAAGPAPSRDTALLLRTGVTGEPQGTEAAVGRSPCLNAAENAAADKSPSKSSTSEMSMIPTLACVQRSCGRWARVMALSAGWRAAEAEGCTLASP